MSQSAGKRATQVVRLCEELPNMLTVGIAESPHHGVWLLLSKSAAHKLDYDATMCPWNEPKDAAERSDTAGLAGQDDEQWHTGGGDASGDR